MIGEQFDESEEICGAVVSVRRAQDKIAIWTKTASNEAAQVTIGKQWKDIIDCNDKLGYLVHEDAKRQEKGAKNRYTVQKIEFLRMYPLCQDCQLNFGLVAFGRLWWISGFQTELQVAMALTFDISVVFVGEECKIALAI